MDATWAELWLVILALVKGKHSELPLKKRLLLDNGMREYFIWYNPDPRYCTDVDMCRLAIPGGWSGMLDLALVIRGMVKADNLEVPDIDDFDLISWVMDPWARAKFVAALCNVPSYRKFEPPTHLRLRRWGKPDDVEMVWFDPEPDNVNAVKALRVVREGGLKPMQLDELIKGLE